MKKTLLIFSLLFNLTLQAQTVTLYSNNFEGSTPITLGTSTTNSWKIASCAGNGTSETGTNALYVSKGGVNPGCDSDGEDQYAFDPAQPSSIEWIDAYTQIVGECTNSHVISFDYKFNPTNSNNVACVVYSLDGDFFQGFDTLELSSDWRNYSVTLPFNTNNTNFYVGFRFQYRDADNGGLGLAVDNVQVTGKPSLANIPQDTIHLCGETTYYPIEADPYVNGVGTWTIISGMGLLSNSSANPTALNSMQPGTTVVVWSVESAVCGNTSDTLVVINGLAPSPANVMDTFYACSIDPLNISTATPMAGTGMWSSPQGAVFADPLSPATTVLTLPTGWSELIWTISSPGCPSTADTMHVFKTGAQKILQSDTTFCYGTDPTLVIYATPTDSDQTISWMFAEGNATVLSIDSNSIEIKDIQMGANRLIYTVDHPLCPTEVDTLLIQVTPCGDFEPIFPTVITPNGDGKNDVFVVHNLEKLYPSCNMTIYNRYGTVVFESTGYVTPWDGTRNGEKLPMGTYFFKLELNDSENTIYNGPISIIH
ncbi:MAG TPA: gliding motility-associated C-terminal domain-containing protein [Taishania sp.]|nr:gliding motility-associated C-terminal domain-containing protein [Taishania sp.]